MNKSTLKKIYLSFLIVLLAGGAEAQQPQLKNTDAVPAPVKVLAAGSLTGAMTAIAQLYTQKTGQKIEAQFGPAGLLRERIENGEQADISHRPIWSIPRLWLIRVWQPSPWCYCAIDCVPKPCQTLN